MNIVNDKFTSFEEELSLEMENNLLYDRKCLLLDIQKEFFINQFAPIKLESSDYEIEI